MFNATPMDTIVSARIVYLDTKGCENKSIGYKYSSDKADLEIS